MRVCACVCLCVCVWVRGRGSWFWRRVSCWSSRRLCVFPCVRACACGMCACLCGVLPVVAPFVQPEVHNANRADGFMFLVIGGRRRLGPVPSAVYTVVVRWYDNAFDADIEEIVGGRRGACMCRPRVVPLCVRTRVCQGSSQALPTHVWGGGGGVREAGGGGGWWAGVWCGSPSVLALTALLPLHSCDKYAPPLHCTHRPTL